MRLMKFVTKIAGIFCILCGVIELQAQVTINTLDAETYDEAIRVVFPSISMAEGYDFSYFVRVKPSSEPEFSLSFVSTRGQVHLTKSESRNGNLFSYFSNIAKSENVHDANELAGRVGLRNHSLVLPRQRFSKYEREFAEKLMTLATIDTQVTAIRRSPSAEQKSATVLLHGTIYEIEYISSNNEFLSFKVYDHPIASKRFYSSMIPWIKNVLSLFGP